MKHLSLVLSIALIASSAFGQQEPEKPSGRPRLGLVLSGGGARGAAHVGVLKVLEEMHVPVDLIAGASMGSIVGGLYATGMSPQEMEDALATMDWDASFEDKVPRKEMPFRRKFDESSFLTKLRIGIQDGHTALPTGLVEGQKLNFILRQLTLPSATVDDFDKLSIPFRATATDVASGEGIVLSHGNVADAMRASMAFPGLFSPVELDGRLLVDGGVAENFPVETARKAGAEVLVAVNIGTPPAGKEKLTSLVKIINQVTNAATARNVRLSKAAIGPQDVFIEPDLGDISFIDFKRVRDAVAAGEKAARAQIEELKQILGARGRVPGLARADATQAVQAVRDRVDRARQPVSGLERDRHVAREDEAGAARHEAPRGGPLEHQLDRRVRPRRLPDRPARRAATSSRSSSRTGPGRGPRPSSASTSTPTSRGTTGSSSSPPSPARA